jgi:hypothetical protein
MYTNITLQSALLITKHVEDLQKVYLYPTELRNYCKEWTIYWEGGKLQFGMEVTGVVAVQTTAGRDYRNSPDVGTTGAFTSCILLAFFVS